VHVCAFYFSILSLLKTEANTSSGRGLPSTSIVTSRGCPYNCTFCNKIVFSSAIRYRSPELVVEEIGLLHEGYGVRNLKIVEEKKIKYQFKFKDFAEAMDFINKVAEILEKENHHPDMCIYYNKVNITLWTHFISGLHENDFILAAKIEKINH